jgi:VCBS repeat-containing protein
MLKSHELQRSAPALAPDAMDMALADLLTLVLARSGALGFADDLDGGPRHRTVGPLDLSRFANVDGALPMGPPPRPFAHTDSGYVTPSAAWQWRQLDTALHTVLAKFLAPHWQDFSFTLASHDLRGSTMQLSAPVVSETSPVRMIPETVPLAQNSVVDVCYSSVSHQRDNNVAQGYVKVLTNNAAPDPIYEVECVGPVCCASAEAGVTVRGAYGTLTMLVDGAYQYEVEADAPFLQALFDTDDVLTDVFAYRVRVGVDAAEGLLEITIACSDRRIRVDGRSVFPSAARTPPASYPEEPERAGANAPDPILNLFGAGHSVIAGVVTTPTRDMVAIATSELHGQAPLPDTSELVLLDEDAGIFFFAEDGAIAVARGELLDTVDAEAQKAGIQKENSIHAPEPQEPQEPTAPRAWRLALNAPHAFVFVPAESSAAPIAWITATDLDDPSVIQDAACGVGPRQESFGEDNATRPQTDSSDQTITIDLATGAVHLPASVINAAPDAKTVTVTVTEQGAAQGYAIAIQIHAPEGTDNSVTSDSVSFSEQPDPVAALNRLSPLSASDMWDWPAFAFRFAAWCDAPISVPAVTANVAQLDPVAALNRLSPLSASDMWDWPAFAFRFAAWCDAPISVPAVTANVATPALSKADLLFAALQEAYAGSVANVEVIAAPVVELSVADADDAIQSELDFETVATVMPVSAEASFEPEDLAADDWIEACPCGDAEPEITPECAKADDAGYAFDPEVAAEFLAEPEAIFEAIDLDTFETACAPLMDLDTAIASVTVFDAPDFEVPASPAPSMGSDHIVADALEDQEPNRDDAACDDQGAVDLARCFLDADEALHDAAFDDLIATGA